MAKKRRQKYYDHMDRFSEMHPKMRRQMEDSMMIHEDHSAIANLPQGVKYHEWPRYGSANLKKIGDTIATIDEQINADVKKMEKEFGPEKY